MRPYDVYHHAASHARIYDVYHHTKGGIMLGAKCMCVTEHAHASYK